MRIGTTGTLLLPRQIPVSQLFANATLHSKHMHMTCSHSKDHSHICTAVLNLLCVHVNGWSLRPQFDLCRSTDADTAVHPRRCTAVRKRYWRTVGLSEGNRQWALPSACKHQLIRDMHARTTDIVAADVPHSHMSPATKPGENQ